MAAQVAREVIRMAKTSQAEVLQELTDSDPVEELSAPPDGSASPPLPSLPMGRIFAGSVSHLALPVPKALWYVLPPAARARKGPHSAASVPLPGASPLVAAHVAGDEFARAIFAIGRMGSALAASSRVDSEMREALPLFEERGWLADPGSYHAEPVLPKPATEWPKLRKGPGGWESMSFLSGYAPDPAEPGAERWNGYVSNRLASAYVLRRPGPGPWVIGVHGMSMGRPQIDRLIFRAHHLHHDLGLNVLLPVLPLHGSRRADVRPRPMLPTTDAMDDIHGLAQSAYDVRTLLAWVRGQDATGIGLMGMSLGGYVTALVAGLEPALDCVIAGIPAVDFPAIFAAHTPRPVRRMPWFQEHVELARTLHQVVSPCSFTPATPVNRRYIYAGTADRLLDPVQQGGALWEHWGRPQIYWFDRGHVVHVRGADVGRFVDQALRETGLAT
jgi:hypothetical protein